MTTSSQLKSVLHNKNLVPPVDIYRFIDVKERVQLYAISTLAKMRIDFSNYFWPPSESKM